MVHTMAFQFANYLAIITPFIIERSLHIELSIQENANADIIYKIGSEVCLIYCQWHSTMESNAKVSCGNIKCELLW